MKKNKKGVCEKCEQELCVCIPYIRPSPPCGTHPNGGKLPCCLCKAGAPDGYTAACGKRLPTLGDTYFVPADTEQLMRRLDTAFFLGEEPGHARRRIREELAKRDRLLIQLTGSELLEPGPWVVTGTDKHPHSFKVHRIRQAGDDAAHNYFRLWSDAQKEARKRNEAEI